MLIIYWNNYDFLKYVSWCKVDVIINVIFVWERKKLISCLLWDIVKKLYIIIKINNKSIEFYINMYYVGYFLFWLSFFLDNLYVRWW